MTMNYNEGALDDQLNSFRLKNEIMSIINITSMIVRRTVKLGETTTIIRNQ